MTNFAAAPAGSIWQSLCFAAATVLQMAGFLMIFLAACKMKQRLVARRRTVRRQAPSAQVRGPAMHTPGNNGEAFHQRRRASMRLRRPQELRSLEGPWFPGSVLVIFVSHVLTVVFAQSAVWAAEMGSSLCLACSIGAIVNLQMLNKSILYHDGAHGLLHGRWNAEFAFILSALMSSAMGFQESEEHAEHHRNTYSSQDPDAQQFITEPEGWKRPLWLACAPLIRALKLVSEEWPTSLLKFPHHSLYIASSHLLLSCLLGWQVTAMLLTAWCFRDWTPAGLLSQAEHFTWSDNQPTWSTYSFRQGVWCPFGIRWFELLMGNLMYHVEHHDFPRVSWWHLPHLHELFEDDYAQLTTFDLGNYAWEFYVRKRLSFNQAFHW